MANPSLQIGNDNWAIKEDNLLGYSTAGSRFVPQPITMTRATLGTRVNPSGLIEDVELLGSELTSPLNFLSTWLEASVDSKTSNTFTVGGSGRGMYFMLPENKTVKINVSGVTGSVELRYRTITGGAGTVLGDFDTDLYLTTTNATTNIYLRATGAGTVSVTDVSVKEATIDNLPRVDYTDGTSSLLVEPQRTNKITYSSDFSQSSWLRQNLTVELNSAVSPSGDSDASKLVEGSSNTTHRILTSAGLTISGDVSISVFAKKGERNWIKLLNNNLVGAFFDLENGVIGSVGGGIDAKIENYGNGWYRCSFTATAVANERIGIYTSIDGINLTYQGDGTSGVYVYGATIEEGSYATSYIPTSGSTVTRNQETYTKTGISDKINSTEGVLFAEIAALVNLDTTNPDRGFSISDGSTNNTIYIYFQSATNKLSIILISGGTIQFSSSTTSFDVTSFNKVALKYKQNDFALWVNGIEVATDSSGNTPTGLSKLSFDNGAGNDKFFGKVKQLQVFKTALSDSELATLTT